MVQPRQTRPDITGKLLTGMYRIKSNKTMPRSAIDNESHCKLTGHEFNPGLEVIKPEFILRLKIKCNDWLLADMCPQVANHCALF